MGANYHLKRGDEVEHIGKSSARCRFLFAGSSALRSFADWRERLKEGQILDGNDDPVTLEEFERRVEAKKGERILDYDWIDAEGHPFMLGEFS
jgi:hypothetical protein